MNRCKNCGKPLEDDSSMLCPACAAMERSDAKAGRAGVRTIRRMALVAAVLAVVLIVLVSLSVVFSRKYNPVQFTDQLTQALAAGDTKALTGLVAGKDIAVSEENLAALCRAFSTEEARAALTQQLEAQIIDPTLTGSAYPALSVEEDRVFLGYSEYRLAVQSVQLMLSTSAANPLLTLNDTACTGEVVSGGVLYKNLFPGRYTCLVTAASSTGQTVTGTATELDLSQTSEPTVFNGALPLSDITVSGCTSDEATILVNDQAIAAKPVGGTVTIPQIAVGSTIRFTYTAPHGAVTTGVVQFTDQSVTALTFGEVTTTGGVPDKAGVDALLRTYYSAYLDAVNQQDASKFQALVSETLFAEQSAGISAADKTANIYEFTDAVSEEASVSTLLIGEAPGFRCNATFSYTYTGKETHETLSAAEKKSCEFIFLDGQWKLNRLVGCTDENYAANSTAALDG